MKRRDVRHKGDPRKRKRRKVESVVIKHPKRRSTIPRTLQTRVDKTQVRKITSAFVLDSTGGDVGGSTMLLEPWRAVAPWNASYTIPSSGNSNPIGFTELDLQYKHYVVLGCKVKLLWQPSFVSEGITPTTTSVMPRHGMLLLRRWDSGAIDIRTNNHNATYSNPRNKILFHPATSQWLHDSAETDIENITGAVAKNYRVSHYGKPTMFLAKDQVEHLNESYGQRVDGTVINPDAPNQWRLWIEILPDTLNVGSEYCYYNLVIKVDWYIKLYDPLEAGT